MAGSLCYTSIEGKEVYWLYSRDTAHDHARFSQPVRINLFGCKAGFIPKLLSPLVPPGKSHPHEWHVPVREALERSGHPNSSVVIDLMPNNAQPFLNLFELRDLWGYSDSGWTPALLHLRELLNEKGAEQGKPSDFRTDERLHYQPVYSFLYLAGTISDGRLVGRWTAPGASPTNSALLWPAHLRYFLRCIRLD
jgi:hypothetical protein